jgi:type VI secretion system protein ImpC
MAFEEMAETPEHERYLWGSAAVACGCLLARSFADRGWSFRPGEHRDLDGLPLHTYTHDNEPCVQSPSEAWLTERAAERALERGLMPVVARRSTDSVRVIRFQSIADPAAPLAGRWGN